MRSHPRIGLNGSSSRGRIATPAGMVAHPAFLLFAALLAACGGGGDGGIVSRPTCSITSVIVTPSAASVNVGATTQLSATVSSSQCNPTPTVAWNSSDASVASVSSTGAVTGVAVGTATMTASAGSTVSSAVVTVTPRPVATVEVTPPTASTPVGQSVTLSAVTKDAQGNVLSGRTIVWSSSNVAIASVAGGVVTALATGTATITATAEGRAGVATVTVTAIPVASVTVTPGVATAFLGQNLTLTATLRDAQGVVLSGRAVTWSSSNVAVASVNGGTVTGVALGSATITASSEGRSGTAVITVSNVPVASVAVTSTATTLVIGATATASAVARAADGSVISGRAIAWSSSNASVATINASTGVLTAVATGTALIQATVDGTVGQISVTVNAALENTRIAWAIVDDASATIGVPYVPNPAYSYNATGGAIVAERTATGRYLVRFARLAKSGVAANRETVIVSSIGVNGQRCVTEVWADINPSDLQVGVTCMSITGALLDAQFEIAVIGSNTLSSKNAFIWSPVASSTTTTTVPTSYAFATGGGPQPVVNRLEAGRYIAFMGSTGFSTSVALVSTYSTASSADCHVEGWSAPNGDVFANCRGATAAALVDSRFTALLAEGGRAGKRWSFAWSDNPSPALGVVTVPPPSAQKQSNGQQLTVTRTAVGTYFVTFTGLRRNAGNPEAILVSSYGGTATGMCQTQAWGDSGSNMAVGVHCWDLVTGQKADSRFTILFLE